MTDLAAHGIEVTLPAGWEGRVFRRPLAGEVARGRGRRRARAAGGDHQRGACTSSTIALPLGIGDFASGAVDKLGSDDVLIVLFEYDAGERRHSRCSRRAGPPAHAHGRRLQPQRLQRADPRPGRRAEVLPRPGPRVLPLRGDRLVRRAGSELVKRVNEVLATLTIEPLDATGTTPTDDHAADDRRTPTTDVADHRRADHDDRAHHRRRPPRPTGGDDAVSVLAGPFAIAAVLLAVGGAAKAVRPARHRAGAERGRACGSRASSRRASSCASAARSKS